MNFQFLFGTLFSLILCIHSQEQCGGPPPTEGQCGGAPTEGTCGGDVGHTAAENNCEKLTFYDVVGVGIPMGGCGGGGSYEDLPEGQCGAPAEGSCGSPSSQEASGGQCGNPGDGNQGQCGAGGASDDDDGVTMFLAGILTSFYQQFDDLSEKETKRDFAKIIPKIDGNKDKRITFDELYKWTLQLIEEDAANIDLSVFEIMNMDKDGDKKISWDEYEAEQKKVLSKNEKADYKSLAQGLKKEKIRFQYADSDKDGYINTKELPRLVLHDSFVDMDGMALEHAMIDYDQNSDGIVTKEEYIEAASRDPTMFDDHANNFKHLDKNGDGLLSGDEMRRQAMENTATPHIRAELKTIVEMLDHDNDGALTYDELSDGHQYLTDSKIKLDEDILQARYNEEYK